MPEPLRKMYLSFADDDNGGFLGACVVYGFDIIDAVRRAHALGINPGGEVLCIPVPPGCGSLLPMDRLLSKDDMEKIDGAEGVSVKDMTDEELRRLGFA